MNMEPRSGVQDARCFFAIRALASRILWLISVFLGANCALGQSSGVSVRAPVEPFWSGRFPERLPDSAELAVINAFPNLAFEDPIGLLHEPRSTRLHVYTRQGQVYSFENSPGTSSKVVVLDIRRQTQGWDDCGLLGMAFHPEFGAPGSPNRGYIYVYYQYTCCAVGSREQRPALANPQFVSSNRLSRFTIPDGSRRADLNSELVLIDQRDRNVWHNGGGMFFHPDDGFLYLSLGDEGGSNSQFANDQTISRNLFSGVIRIDVDQNPARSHRIRRQPQDGRTANYFIPNDNPFVDPSGRVLEEFWSLGLREPHRMTFDLVTRSIWSGDVGQEQREEINLIEKGGNYQWAYRQGTLTGPKARPPKIIGEERPPLYEYPHGRSGNSVVQENAVIGGYLYRGIEHADLLAGQYIFGDNGSGRIWALDLKRKNPGTKVAPLLQSDVEAVSVRPIAQMPPGTGYGGLSGFGVDHGNEVYLCQMGTAGKIYRLANPLEVPGAALPPRQLSQTGIFTDLPALRTAPGLIPYEVNSPLWSDGAKKFRWIAVPNNGAPHTTNETIRFDAINEWTFPMGTLFVKHFALSLDETMPGPFRHLETRVLVRDSQGGAYGVTYRWRDDQSDADLLLESATQEFAIKTSSGERRQVWNYPGPRDCMACHTPVAGYVLGVNTAQLNRVITDPARGSSGNQLRFWNQLALFEPKLEESILPELPHLVAMDSASATLQDKARSYLAANCAQCHRPGGVRAALDARYQTPLALQGLIGAPINNRLGLDHAALIVPGAPGASALLARINRLGESQMPPLTRNRIDAAAVATIGHWIRSLPPSSPGSALPQLLPPYLYWDSERRNELHLNAENVADYQMQHSENLRDWLPIQDLPAFRGTFTLRTEPPIPSAAFFRVVTVPPLH